MNKEPIVTFVGISYKEVDEIYMFIGMLRCMKNPRWKAIIYHDGPNEWMKGIVEGFNDNRITYIENDINKGAWGCYNRIEALKLIDTEYVVQTTIQEYYVPVFVDIVEEIKKKDYDFAHWPVVHHQFQYEILDSEPRCTKIDWSNFVMKTHIARKVGIKHPTAFVQDGMFVEDVMRSNLVRKMVKINKILNIKN